MNTCFERQKTLAKEMERREIDALLVTPSSDFLYLTGSAKSPAQRHTVLLITPDRAVVIIPQFEVCNEPKLAQSIELAPYSDSEDVIRLIAGLLPQTGRIAVGGQTRAGLLLPLQARLPGAQFLSADDLLASMRSVKSASEIGLIETAQRMAERALLRLISEPLIGRTELEVSRRLQQLRIEEGMDTAGGGIVASGENSASAHHVNGSRIIQKGDVLMFDIGGTYMGYHADFTRTFAVGAIPDGFEEIYAIVLEAFYAGMQAAQRGAPADQVDRAARSVIKKAGYGAYFTHRLGHGIGLDVHEHPFISLANSAPLAQGNVFSCEPGVYLPGRFGVRIEDLLALDSPDSMQARSLNTLSKTLQII